MKVIYLTVYFMINIHSIHINMPNDLNQAKILQQHLLNKSNNNDFTYNYNIIKNKLNHMKTIVTNIEKHNHNNSQQNLNITNENNYISNSEYISKFNYYIHKLSSLSNLQ